MQRAGPDPEADRTRLALTTAAQCFFGILELSRCPGGDREVSFPLIMSRFSTEELNYDEMRDASDTVTSRTWVDAFAICVASGPAPFELALNERLVWYRADAGEDPMPRSLLPPGTIVLAALAVQAHGWDLRTKCGYPPASPLNAPAPAAS